ncbi:hypothetical protein [Rhodovulum sp. PH10]|uniref:hypothetical protein n=1 Tax=Rhodovulum sp. PH10 TaxID=1187851 RepID=UPI0012FC75DC|nr:hypothetical protein [Rhodovulum sp. PH10]
MSDPTSPKPTVSPPPAETVSDPVPPETGPVAADPVPPPAAKPEPVRVHETVVEVEPTPDPYRSAPHRAEPPRVEPAADTPPGYEPLKKPQPPKSIVDHAMEFTQAYSKVLLADLRILWIDIKPGLFAFAAKQKYFLIGLVVLLILILWIF